ncbi:MAG: cytochrome c biogenesis protein ResB [Deltaproteobacteria bacterium]|nr:cytochrome c biogenesis protein ResB [Deltaproteobacteria bacterium]
MDADKTTTGSVSSGVDRTISSSGGIVRAVSRLDRLLWNFFSDVRVGVGLLVLLALLTMAGTFVPQVTGNISDVTGYIDRIGRDRGMLYNRLGLFDLYNAWYFNATLGLMCLALIVVSLDRFPKHWKLFRQWQPTPSPSKFTTSSIRDRLALPKAVEKRGQIRSALAAVFGRVTEAEKDGSVYFYVNRGRINRLGLYFVHVGILVISFGSYYGSKSGFSYGQMRILEGFATHRFLLVDRLDEKLEPVVYRMELPFEVRNDQFSVEFYRDPKTGVLSERAKEFRSKLTFFEGGKEVLKTDLLVNHPYTYRGITFYQASYEKAGGTAHLLMGTPEATVPVAHEAELDQPFRVAGSDHVYKVTQFIPEFRTESRGDLGPAIVIEEKDPDGNVVEVFPVLQNYPGLDRLRNGRHVFEVERFVPRYVTGLQLTSDPGIEAVWAGCAMMVIGLLIAFYIPHRQVWVRLDGQGVALAAFSNKHEDAVSRRFTALVERIVSETGARPVEGAAAREK